jgi:hypothetical protein
LTGAHRTGETPRPVRRLCHETRNAVYVPQT